MTLFQTIKYYAIINYFIYWLTLFLISLKYAVPIFYFGTPLNISLAKLWYLLMKLCPYFYILLRRLFFLLESDVFPSLKHVPILNYKNSKSEIMLNKNSASFYSIFHYNNNQVYALENCTKIPHQIVSKLFCCMHYIW